MNIIQRFTLRSLLNNKKWTIVTIIGIVIATAMLTAVSTLTLSFIHLVQQATIDNTGEWHASFHQVKSSDISILDNDPRIQRTMVHRNLGYAVLEESKNNLKPYLYISEYDSDSFDKFPVKLLSGRLPENRNELIVPQHIETNAGVSLQRGDTITLEIGQRFATVVDSPERNIQILNQNTPYQPEVEQFTPEFSREYTIVGVFARPGHERFGAPGYTVISYLDSASLQPTESVTVSVLFQKLNRSLYENSSSISDNIGLSNDAVTFNTELLRYYGLLEGDKFQELMLTFALIIIVIIMIASIALIYNAFAISVSERIRQLGMLASVGATKRQKRANVYFEGFLVGLVGIPLGVLAGIIGIQVTLHIVSPMLSSMMSDTDATLQLIVSPTSIAVAIVLAIITIMVSLYIPGRRASKITPIDAIRQSQEIHLTSKGIKTSKLTKALFGLEGELALKNLKRSKKKYRATILSLTISIVLFLTVSTMAYYTQTGADIRLNSTNMNFDVLLDITNLDSNLQENFSSALRELESVSEFSKYDRLHLFMDVTDSQLTETAKQFLTPNQDGLYNASARIIGLDKESFNAYLSNIGLTSKFNDNANPQVVLVNRSVGYHSESKKHIEGSILQLQSGDNVPLYYITWDHTTNTSHTLKYNLHLVGVTSTLPLGAITPSFHQLLLVTTRDIVQSMKSDHSDTAMQSRTLLAMKSQDIDSLTSDIDFLFHQFNIEYSSVHYTNLHLQAKEERRALVVMGVFIYGFITLISLICIANIFNTVSTNISLRRKEFAMLRSVGMTPKSFNRMIRFESIFYGLKALLYGLPVSAGIGYILYRTLNSQISFPFSLPWKDYILATVLVFFIVGTTMLYSIAKIKKENIIDALKDETM